MSRDGNLTFSLTDKYIIMDGMFKTLTEALNGGRPTLTARQFLGKEEGISYFKPPELIAFAKTLRPNEISALETIFEGMADGCRVGGTIASKKDKGGRRYAFVTMDRANANSGGKYILEGGMVQLLKDYMNAKFVIGFTLEELVEEALNG
ncbi:MAG: hypothetical protein ACTHNW_01585 [Mucilaginibacter sp.]